MNTILLINNEKFYIDNNFINLNYNLNLINQIYNILIFNLKKHKKILKNRALVKGSNKKLWAQKGTGRARVGSGKVAQFRSGGVAFTTKTSYKDKKINKKMYLYFFKYIIKNFYLNKQIIFIKKFNFNLINTKTLINKLKLLTFKKKISIIINNKNDKLFLSSKNIKNVNVFLINYINILKIINSEILIFEIEAFKTLCKILC